MQTLKIILCIVSALITTGAICYGAYTDYKSRIIPNFVNLIIALAWIIDITNWSWEALAYRAVSVLLIFIVDLIGTLITKSEGGGGDLKLYLALAFNMGFLGAIFTLAGAGIFALAYMFIRKKDKKTMIPICTFTAPSYLIVQCALLVIAFVV